MLWPDLLNNYVSLKASFKKLYFIFNVKNNIKWIIRKTFKCAGIRRRNVQKETDLHIMHPFCAETAYTNAANSRNLDVQIQNLRDHTFSGWTTFPKPILTSWHRKTWTRGDKGVPFWYTRQILAKKTHLNEPKILLHRLWKTEHWIYRKLCSNFANYQVLYLSN